MVGRVICNNCGETYICNVDKVNDDYILISIDGINYHTECCKKCKPERFKNEIKR